MRYMNSCRFNPGIVRPRPSSSPSSPRLRRAGRLCLALLCLLWFGAPSLRATDRYVSPAGTNDTIGGYTNWAGAATNIQSAVNVATNSETVWLTSGTYYAQSSCAIQGAMVVITNAITVRSFSGSYANTVVNGNWPAYTNRIFLVSNALAVVSGLTITNGYMFTNANGAGVYIYDGMLSNCLITGNTITNIATGPLADGNYYSGAGVWLTKGTVSHCIINGNRAVGSTAWNPGIYTPYAASSPTAISNCIFAYNTNTGGGRAAVYLAAVGGAMNGCKIYGNFNCPGIQVSYGAAMLTACVISNNSAQGIITGDGILRSCLVVNNGTYGVSTYADRFVTLENCTFAGNGTYGIYINPSQDTLKYKIENTISYYNGIGGTQNWYATNVTTVFFTNCCAYPDAPGVNNITNPPLFVDTNSGNYRLSASSPCFNTGVNRGPMANYYDLDGRARIRYGTVDMGAYERINSGTIFVFH